MKAHGALCLLVLLLAASSAFAVPDFWINPGSNPQQNGPKTTPACTAHPDKGYGGHPAVQPDTTITFTLEIGTKKVTAVCPGKSYTLSVSWPNGGLGGYALVTTTVGTFSDSQDACKNRAVFESSLEPTHTTTLAVPAGTTATSLELEATAAGGDTDDYHQATLNVPISSTACTAAAAAPATGTTTTPDDDNQREGAEGKGKGTTTTTGGTTTGTTADAGSASVTAFTASMCKQPVQTKGASCGNSSLGYSCSHAAGPVTTHWTIGGCAPANPCTKTYTVRNSALDAAQTYLHYAATYKTTGYVAVGFARNPGHMAGTDAVIGWVNDDGSPTVDAYHITSGDSVSQRGKYTGDQQWMALSGASKSDGYTTICFSRPMDAPTSSVLKSIPAAAAVGMNWAVGGQGVRTTTRQHATAKGYTFNPITGAVTEDMAGDKYSEYHGILMALAWVVLAPVGVLFARHRWALGDFKLGKVHFWFHAHRTIQFLAVILFVGGLAIAWTKLSGPGGSIGQAHVVLAYLLLAMASLQVVAAFIRPAGDAPNRRYWNLFHWNLGRLTLATGIINVFIGVVVYDRKYGQSVTIWFALLGAALALWVVAEVVLSLLSLRRGAAEAARGPGKDEVEIARMQQEQQQQQFGGARPLYPQHSANVV